MSESAPKSSSGHPFLKSTKYLLLAFLAIWLLQLGVNPPERRPYIACWLPYLADEAVTVKLRRLLTPKDHTAIMEQSYRAANWNNSCINTVSGWSWVYAEMPWQKNPNVVAIASEPPVKALTEDQKAVNSTLDLSDLDAKYKIKWDE